MERASNHRMLGVTFTRQAGLCSRIRECYETRTRRRLVGPGKEVEADGKPIMATGGLKKKRAMSALATAKEPRAVFLWRW